jgi:hypothetical protein
MFVVAFESPWLTPKLVVRQVLWVLVLVFVFSFDPYLAEGVLLSQATLSRINSASSWCDRFLSQRGKT